MPKGSFRKKRLSHSLDDDPNSTFEAGGLNAKTASDQATMNTNINEYPAPFLSLVGLPYISVESSAAFSYYACGPTVQGESYSHSVSPPSRRNEHHQEIQTALGTSQKL
jgi:hypothetical protein